MELSFKERFKLGFLKWCGIGLMHLLYLTCRTKFVGQPRGKEPCVVLCWHSKIAFTPFCFTNFWQNKEAKTIISEHFDGELITQISAFFHIGAIRGSSTRGGVKALASALRELKNGVDVAITPDGPRGPYHSVSDGAVLIAQKAGVKLVFITFKASRFWRTKSWDKLVIPKPFSTITYTLSEPFSIEGLTLEEAKEAILQRMQEE